MSVPPRPFTKHPQSGEEVGYWERGMGARWWVGPCLCVRFMLALHDAGRMTLSPIILHKLRHAHQVEGETQ